MSFSPTVRDVIYDLLPHGTWPEKVLPKKYFRDFREMPTHSHDICAKHHNLEEIKYDKEKHDVCWSVFPFWPPDLFAVVARLIEQSGCYTNFHPVADGVLIDCPPDVKAKDRRKYLLNRKNLKTLQGLGEAWSQGIFQAKFNKSNKQLNLRRDQSRLVNCKPAPIQQLWNQLLQCYCAVIVPPPIAGSKEDQPDHDCNWHLAALKLLIIADTASIGIGFPPKTPERRYKNARYVRRFPFRWPQGLNHIWSLDKPFRNSGKSNDEYTLEDAPTACLLVPAEKVVVQPKTRVPQVGCTLRSLSHHLALLPSIGQVQSTWNQVWGGPDNTDTNDVFNLLLVPFPFKVTAKCFSPCDVWRDDEGVTPKWGYFDVEQKWLGENGSLMDTRSLLADFIVELVRTATYEVTEIHGIVLPELSIDFRTFELIRDRLVSNGLTASLDFLVAGVSEEIDGRKRNRAYTIQFGSDPRLGEDHANSAAEKAEQGQPYFYVYQDKHHRWRLNADQIRQYSLGDALDPQVLWWENIPIGNEKGTRELNFFVFRSGATFTTLICEDLARVDPRQRVLRSIGPNLVISILMDGPQLNTRWSAKYAGVLADDPGSATLSLTSIGFVNRSRPLHSNPSRSVAYWKDSITGFRELELPKGDDGIILSLSNKAETEFSLDTRSDSGAARNFYLSGTIPVHIKGNETKWQRIRDWTLQTHP